MPPISPVAAAIAAALTITAAALAGPGDHLPADFEVREDESVVAHGILYPSMNAYLLSERFRTDQCRCGLPIRLNEDPPAEGAQRGGTPIDCALSNTLPSETYAPGDIVYEIPVVFHVIRRSNGITGNIPIARLHEQIEIFNEDFNATPGTPGANGDDAGIRFVLAETDPTGAPTDGFTLSSNDAWFNDQGNYFNTLAWDPDRYLNIYTNSAAGALGYVPFLPQEPGVGTNGDRVVLLWSSVGRNAPVGAPFNLGRTGTHEVGHYLGLKHVFSFFCPGGNCSQGGDSVCDTTPQVFPTNGCSNGNSCGSPDNSSNYMDYTDDRCMQRFTPNQVRRMRCTLEHYRPALARVITGCRCDLDASSDVGIQDLLQYLELWIPRSGSDGVAGELPDFNNDGLITIVDLLGFLDCWIPASVGEDC